MKYKITSALKHIMLTITFNRNEQPFAYNCEFSFGVIS